MVGATRKRTLSRFRLSVGCCGKLAQLLLQPIEIHRLGEELGGTKFGRLAPSLIVALGGHHHHRELGEALLDLGQKRQPVHARHVDVGRMTISCGSIPSSRRWSAPSPEFAKRIT